MLQQGNKEPPKRKHPFPLNILLKCLLVSSTYVMLLLFLFFFYLFCYFITVSCCLVESARIRLLVTW